eukprot:TRINITY_DN61835_c0_g1_i1.p1 TRINITY_DN61835_c0_g1~~TRINITY_DN61835_c0_g1_i1.p1  ORF type:complete len:387 (+),score=89.21 TRINITY_DN61835_c0_g1_i1:126-1286(+)
MPPARRRVPFFGSRDSAPRRCAPRWLLIYAAFCCAAAGGIALLRHSVAQQGSHPLRPPRRGVTAAPSPPQQHHARAPPPALRGHRARSPSPPPARRAADRPTPPPTAAAPRTAAPSMGRGEPQLLVVWHGAMKQLRRIAQDIAKEFRVLRVLHLDMPRDTYRENLWRLYMGKGGLQRKGMPLKVRQCGGTGDFVAFLVWDADPVYKAVKTAHGVDVVSEHMHNAKYKYRKWAGGSGFQVHGTYTVAEAQHDVFLLFGSTAWELAARPAAAPYDPSAPLPPARTGDLIGYGGAWPTCDRLYTAVRVTASAAELSPPDAAGCAAALQRPSPRIRVAVPRTNDTVAVLAAVHGTDPDGRPPGPSAAEGESAWRVRIGEVPAEVSVRSLP